MNLCVQLHNEGAVAVAIILPPVWEHLHFCVHCGRLTLVEHSPAKNDVGVICPYNPSHCIIAQEGHTVICYINNCSKEKCGNLLRTKEFEGGIEVDDVDLSTDYEDEYIKNYQVTKENKIAFFILGLLTFCGLRSFVVRKLAFSPPKIVGYMVDDNNKFVYLNQFSNFDVNEIVEQSNIGVDYKTVRSGSYEVASLLIYRKPLDLTKQTILFSHGNNTDIGYMFPSYLNMVFQSSVNVMTYDYSGYGLSNKDPSEKNIYKNIKMVYDYLVKELKVNPANIILYGHSLGTCTSSYLISLKGVKVGGCILHSPLASGIKLLFPFQKKNLPWLDVFKNSEMLKKVSLLPVYIMHGKMDKDIPYYHAVILLNTLKKNFQKQCKKKGYSKKTSAVKDENQGAMSLIKFWGVEDCDHNDIEVSSEDSTPNRSEDITPNSSKDSTPSSSKDSTITCEGR
ncbi:alpha/beta hydrolase fold domain containing protein, putative [Plasmodium ovale wallikeri]|uniref:Alpha/beta hydrolase fold domain containing protein, putative n=1 Tax=Plasmodium ovale wallikeri TaxID=864142 RepID=A0A1A8YUK1_PLAOA|nr:alpha/beta hydrolase fold domain containing protein, putative [Plasmodium ovale wallikeri]